MFSVYIASFYKHKETVLLEGKYLPQLNSFPFSLNKEQFCKEGQTTLSGKVSHIQKHL